MTPDTFREFDGIDGIDHEFYKVEQRLATEGFRFCREVDAARRELLATGFPVPNSWLTVQPLAQVHAEQWRLGKSKKWRGRIAFKSPERGRVRAILDELYAERMRLEALAQAGAGDKAGGLGPVVPDTRNKNDIAILRAMTPMKEVAIIAVIAAAIEPPLSARTVGERLPLLEKAGYVHRPEGKRSGWGVTPKGRTCLIAD